MEPNKRRINKLPGWYKKQELPTCLLALENPIVDPINPNKLRDKESFKIILGRPLLPKRGKVCTEEEIKWKDMLGKFFALI